MPFLNRDRKYWIGALAIGIVLAGSSLWRILTGANASLQPTATPLPQDPQIEVFFNQSEASVYTEPYRQIERQGDNLEQVLITAIEQATDSIDVAVQAFNLPGLAQALAQQARQGVKIRLILENQYVDNPDEPEQLDVLNTLKAAQVPYLDDTADGSKGSGLMHHKFVVIDQRWVITGSANFTHSGIHGDADTPDSRGNANVLLKIDSPALAAHFNKEFNLMWGDGPAALTNSQFGLQKAVRSPQPVFLSGGQITLQFSPHSTRRPWAESTNGLIAHSLKQATNRIDLALFVFSEQRLANQLHTQVQSGITLRALIDPGFVYRSYSEALDMLGTALPDHRCQIEADNQPWSHPITTVGSPRLPNGDKLHHKFAVVDKRTVIVGSHNWSHAANTKNDETLLIIDNPTVARHFHREFERLYREPLLGITPRLTEAKQNSQKRCP